MRLANLSRALVVSSLLAYPAAAQRAPRRLDVLIVHGTVYDGTGAPGRRVDVGLRGDRIAFIGDAGRAGVQAARTIDARGLVVAPGFIDPHTHAGDDLSSPARRVNAAWLMQGVTTVVVNNDGGGPVDVGAALDRWEKTGVGTNVAAYAPFGSIRERVLGASSAAPTASQLDTMRALVDRAMRGGALGLSTGLYYSPQSYARTDEVIALARVAARYGGIYDSHIRDESDYGIGLVAAVDEAISIGRQAGLPAHIAHIKALGTDVWGRSDSVIAHVRAARAAGLEVTADQYPYDASGTSVEAALLPRWVEAGGRDSLLARLRDSATRARIAGEVATNLRRRNGAKAMLITGARDTTLVGRTLEQIAAAWSVDPVTAALRIVEGGDADVASFNMNEGDIERFMRERWVMTSSDGSAGHPRKFGSFPRKLREYVLGKHVLTLAQGIQSSSSRTAAALRLADRGTIAEGKFADVIVFDTATVSDRATYERPELLATGIRWVFVNGVAAVADGKLTGALAGRALRHVGAQSSSASASIAVAAQQGTPAAAADSDSLRARIAAWRQAHDVDVLREFAELLAIPNVASDTANIGRNAQAIVTMLERRGVKAQLLDAPGSPPAVYGELAVPGATRTVVLYAHYDGQPVTLSQWATPPWQPTLRDGPLAAGGNPIAMPTAAGTVRGDYWLYARSAGDDKASIIAQLAALDALRAVGARPSVNVKFFYEGEEEAGSPHIEEMLRRHASLLKGDLWLFGDGPVHQSRRMQVVFGARGVTGLTMTVYGPNRALHSGHYGNWAPNPVVMLANLIASMRDDDGRVRIAGWYDDVVPISAAERAALKTVPPVDSALRAELDLGATEAHDAPLAERIMLPALNLRGFSGGAVGATAANAVPTQAQASIDLRLVPKQTPERLRRLLEAHVRREGYFIVDHAPTPAERRAHAKIIRIDWESGYAATRVAMGSPVARAVVDAASWAMGSPVIQVPTLGGSLPTHVFEQVLGAPLVVLPIANHDDNQHAANENLRLQNLWDGIALYAGLLARIDASWGKPRP